MDLRTQRSHQWVWTETAVVPPSRNAKLVAVALVARGTIAVVVLAIVFIRSDWGGTPYLVTNKCATPIYIDNGSDGLRLEPAQTITVPGFGDLELSIGLPGEPKSITETFASSPVEIAGDACPL